MTRLELISELYRKIAGITCRFTFTAPVEDADLETVRGELARAVPGYPVRVQKDLDPRYVRVEVDWSDGAGLYRRQMIVATG